MKPIILLTDFGWQDNFVGVMKGVILKINPGVTMLDLCHNVTPQSIVEGAFLLKNSYLYFPESSIFLIVIDPGVGSERNAIIVKTKKYTFVAPDNGVLSFIPDDKIEKIIQIKNDRYFLKPVSSTFHGRDVFSPVAAWISRGEPVENFGNEINHKVSIKMPQIKKESNHLIGEVIYIDSFGNLITNIDQKTFSEFVKDYKFEIKCSKFKINKINKSYHAGKSIKPTAVFNSFNNLEISLYKTNASKSLKITKGSKVYLKRI